MTWYFPQSVHCRETGASTSKAHRLALSTAASTAEEEEEPLPPMHVKPQPRMSAANLVIRGGTHIKTMSGTFERNSRLKQEPMKAYKDCGLLWKNGQEVTFKLHCFITRIIPFSWQD